MKGILLFTSLLLYSATICFAALGDFDGKWTGTVNVPDEGTYTINYVFKTDGDKLSGTGQAVGSPKTITDSKISGTEFSFNLANDDGSSMGMPHTGKYYPQGDSIALTVKYAGRDLHVTLKRVSTP